MATAPDPPPTVPPRKRRIPTEIDDGIREILRLSKSARYRHLFAGKEPPPAWKARAH